MRRLQQLHDMRPRERPLFHMSPYRLERASRVPDMPILLAPRSLLRESPDIPTATIFRDGTLRTGTDRNRRCCNMDFAPRCEEALGVVLGESFVLKTLCGRSGRAVEGDGLENRYA